MLFSWQVWRACDIVCCDPDSRGKLVTPRHGCHIRQGSVVNLACCHVSALPLPAQSVKKEWRIGMDPGARCAPQTISSDPSVSTDVITGHMRSLAQSRNPSRVMFQFIHALSPAFVIFVDCLNSIPSHMSKAVCTQSALSIPPCKDANVLCAQIHNAVLFKQQATVLLKSAN